MKYNKYSYLGIVELCKEHFEEILLRKDISHILEHRDIRFINPMGKFDYTKFGNFYFDERGVMMLITDERKYTSYHRPDIFTNSLLSTVPVIFAGVETRMKDSSLRKIFTGDVVSYKCYTSFVRYFSDTGIPGLAGDNAEILFDEKDDIHKEGTVFSEISKRLYDTFDIWDLYWPTEQFHPYGMRREEVIEKAQQSIKEPSFIDGKPEVKKMRKRMYNKKEVKSQHVIKDDDILVNFIIEHPDDDFDEGPWFELVDDDFADNIINKRYNITIKEEDFNTENIKKHIDEFSLMAHKHPETNYVFCDFVETLNISKNMRHEFAMTFWDCYKYNLNNVILPYWLLIYLIVVDGIGND